MIGVTLAFDLNGIAMMGSAAFLLLYAAVNGRHLFVLKQTGANAIIVWLSLLTCLAMFAVLAVYTYQQQPAVAHQRHDAPVDQSVVPVELLGHPQRRVAEDEGADGPRGEPPTLRSRVCVLAGKDGELVGVHLLGGCPQHGSRHQLTF